MKIYTIFSLLCFLLWGISDLFYKKANSDGDRYSDLKTTVVVGIVMGIYATCYMIYKEIDIFKYLMDVLKYLPVSFCYILSMYIGYKGLKYIELSISSPVQNTSGVITSLLLVIFFKEKLPFMAYVAFLLIFIGVFCVSILEKREERVINYSNVNILAIILPIMYCVIDGMGTFLDSLYLDKFGLISEDIALISYEYTFLIVAIICMIFLNKRREKIMLKKNSDMWIAALFETLGQFFYVFAMGADSTINASIVGSYCIMSMFLSSVFLKEKLSFSKYLFLFIAIIGIVMLAFMDL